MSDTSMNGNDLITGLIAEWQTGSRPSKAIPFRKTLQGIARDLGSSGAEGAAGSEPGIDRYGSRSLLAFCNSR
jgi:hypothetical protein